MDSLLFREGAGTIRTRKPSSLPLAAAISLTTTLRPLLEKMIAHICSLPLLFCLILHVAAMGRRPRFEPLPICPDCVPREDILAPGIGFDLTTSYATAAIRYHDGTVKNLAKVGAVSGRARARSLIVCQSGRRGQRL